MRLIEHIHLCVRNNLTAALGESKKWASRERVVVPGNRYLTCKGGGGCTGGLQLFRGQVAAGAGGGRTHQCVIVPAGPQIPPWTRALTRVHSATMDQDAYQTASSPAMALMQFRLKRKMPVQLYPTASSFVPMTENHCKEVGRGYPNALDVIIVAGAHPRLTAMMPKPVAWAASMKAAARS